MASPESQKDSSWSQMPPSLRAQVFLKAPPTPCSVPGPGDGYFQPCESCRSPGREVCTQSRSKAGSPESQSSPLPIPIPEHQPQQPAHPHLPASLTSHAGCEGKKEVNLPQHPEISTKSQTTRQLMATWPLMAPGDTKKASMRILPLVGGLFFEAL